MTELAGWAVLLAALALVIAADRYATHRNRHRGPTQ